MHQSGLTVPDAAPSPEAHCLAKHRARLVASCVLALKVRHSRLIRMRYAKGMTFAEISVEFGVTEPAAHAMHGRAIQCLRELLARRGVTRLGELL
jgi:RNA polymerase sigma factor (sigma-70 family)